MFTLEILDSILASFHKEPTHKKYFKTIETLLYQNVLFKDKLTHLMIVKSLEKLISDNYVVKVISEPLTKDSLDATYELTWEGNFFLFQGGYLGKYYKENEEKKRLLKLENEQRIIANNTDKIQKQQVLLSIILVVFTGVTSVYYVLEILKFFDKVG